MAVRSEGEKTPKRMTARQLRDTGLLHAINEQMLWPLGIVMAVNVETGTVTFTVEDGIVQSGLDDASHKAKHAAFTRLVATRKRLLSRSSEPEAG